MSVCVCLLVTFVNPAKTAEPFEIAVWGGGSWSSGNHVLNEVPVTPTGRGMQFGTSTVKHSI